MKNYFALCLTAGITLIPNLVIANDCSTATVPLSECYLPIDEFEKANTRGVRIDTSKVDIDYATFRANPTYLGTLSTAQVDAIVSALITVLAAPGSLVVNSFDQPEAGAAGFATQVTTQKGFYRSPGFTSKECTVTFGSIGTDGSITCVVKSEQTSFGTPPDGNYTVRYFGDVMGALTAANAEATPQNFNIFISGLFQAMTDAAGGSVSLGGDINSVPQTFGMFRKSVTTGNWSFSGTTGKLVYIPKP
jgi:hypothetical protein